MSQHNARSITERIKHKIVAAFAPLTYQLINDSHQHGPAGLATKRETHFTLLLVSKHFENESTINRHRRVYQTLSQELGTGVHALSLHLYTPSEWQAMDQDARKHLGIPPPCVHHVRTD